MNMKPVELQIAVPRTTEAGRVQQEVQQRPLIDQSLLSAESIREHEVERKRSSNIDESAHNSTINRDEHPQGGQRQHQSSSGQKHDEQEKEQPAEHPYKGKHIDLSL